MSKTTMLAICFIFCVVSGGNAQMRSIGSPSITNFSRVTYKAGTQNWMIQQDNKKGLIYFANNKGLLEFDGTYWQTFSLPNGTIVRSVAIDDKGRIFIGGQDEFGYIIIDENGEKIYHSLTHLVPEPLQSFEDIWKIFILKEGIYFCSDKAIFKLSDDKIEVTKPVNQRFENFFESNGEIYIQEIEGSLYELKNQKLNLLIDRSIFPDERIIAILPYTDDQILLFTFSKGVFLLNESKVQPWVVPVNSFLKDNQAYCAIELKNGNYAIGTPQNGLIIINRKGEPEMHLNVKLGLQNNTVLSITQDVQENLWLGLDNGIDYAEINSPFAKIHSEEGIVGTGYASIVHDDKLFLGTNQGLYYMDLGNDSSPLEAHKFRPVVNGLGQVWSIDKLADQIIVGQHKGASYLEDNALDPFSKIQGAWKFLPLDHHSGYAIEGTYSGLYLYKNKNIQEKESEPANSKNKAQWEVVGKIKGFDESARIFEEDQNGNIWVSHAYKGLFRLALSLDLLTVDEYKLFGPSEGLPDDPLINVAKIRKELVFSTPSGVFKYDGSKNQFIPHQDFIEIFGENRNFQRIIEDEFGDVWFSVDNEFGVIKVEEQGVFNKFKIYYFNQIQEDLVDGFEHVYACDEENIIIGTEKGFLHYTPLEEKDTDFPFDILIRDVVSITNGDSTIYKGNTLPPEEFDFPYSMNDFRFTFSVPYFEKIGYLTYRYRLLGFTENWSEWLPKSEKEYTNLNTGDYIFEVQAKNAYGQISKSTSFPFTIAPPWYWSWYAKIGYILLVILSLAGITKFINEKEKEKTEAFKREQAQKLEHKEAQFKKEVEKSENEIIKLRNEKLSDDIKHKTGQLASATMHLVQKSEILIKIKNDIKNLESDASKEVRRKLQQITRTIESDIQLDENWEQFENYFDQVHENFFKRLRLNYPELTPKDQKLCAYLRMNLTTKEIAPLMNISVRGVEISRYRLRKKLDLNSDVNLVAFMLEL